MADELQLGDLTEEIRNAANILRVDFLDVFAAQPSHKKHASSQDLDGISVSLARRVGTLSTASAPSLHKAAVDLAESISGWPTVKRFAAALKDIQASTRLAERAPPIGWRWKRAGKPPDGVSPSEWYQAAIKQENACRAFLRDDVAARALVSFALEERWLCTLYWFVVDQGRLPSDLEERQLIATAKKADALAIETNTDKLGVSLLALRQAMHDYAARQLGLTAGRIG